MGGKQRHNTQGFWRCEHARFCVEVFYALYINFHSFITLLSQHGTEVLTPKECGLFVVVVFVFNYPILRNIFA